MLPIKRSYCEPSEDTGERFGQVFCKANNKISWQFLLLKVLSEHPPFSPEEVLLKTTLMDHIADQSLCDVMRTTIDGFQEKRNEMLEDAINYPENPSTEVSKNLSDLFEFIQQK
jgi:hypothetical protein